MAVGSPTGTISGVNQTPVNPPISNIPVQAVNPGNVIAAAGIGASQPLTDGATIDVPLNTQSGPFSLQSVTLAGNRTMNLPKNPSPGQRIGFLLKQDGTGSRTVTWATGFLFPAGTPPTLTTTAGHSDYIEFMQIGNAASILAGTVPAYLAAGNGGQWIMTNSRLDFTVL